MQYIIKKNSWHYKMLEDVCSSKLHSLKVSSPYGLFCRYWRAVIFTILFNIIPMVFGVVMVALMAGWFILAPYVLIGSWILDNSFLVFCALYDHNISGNSGITVFVSFVIQAIISLWVGAVLVRERSMSVFPKYLSVPYSQLINHLRKKIPAGTPVKLAKEVPVAPPSAASVFASSVKSKICPMATFEE